jgi:hypothetical protein
MRGLDKNQIKKENRKEGRRKDGGDTHRNYETHSFPRAELV